MGRIPSKPNVVTKQWINGYTRLNQKNLVEGINQNLDSLKEATNGIVDALGGAGSEPASDKTLNQTAINDYSASTTYTEGEVVKYDNKYYRCKVASSQGIAPTNTTNWAQIALSTPVDSALDEDSTNPVQNGVVTAEIGTLDQKIDTKVTKSTATSGEFAYTRNGSTEGTTRIVFDPRANPSINSSIVRRNGENKIYTRDLSAGHDPDTNEVVSRAYTDRRFLTSGAGDARYVKHISTSSYRLVYGRNIGGDDTSFQAITGNTAHTVAYRGDNGEIRVGMPGVNASTDEEKLAANKKYVDTILEEKSATAKQYVDGMFTRITGYDAAKTQVLKNINGTLTWVDE